MSRAWRCTECDKISAERDLLRAPNPFHVELEICGCPHCFGVECFDEVCDEPGCEQPSSCGWPSSSGYRRTCGEHWRKADDEDS